ncbi:MAG TPA: heavy metal-binding domain-containing protein [Thermoanaerobaculia bacterium]|nr:heavy metal-binding domain-containing protein [Thermoanaerobaculia bacterium]
MFAILIAALLLDPAATLRPDSYDAPVPASVANAARASALVAMPEVVLYTCAMHPEVTSMKPGACPKCGMTLVKKAKR